MNGFIKFFYNIYTNDIVYYGRYYSFMYNGYLYKLYIVDDNINTNYLMNIDKKLLGFTLISEIIINNNGDVISNFNGYSYILIKVYCNPNKSITLEEINYFANCLYDETINVNWGVLWSKKIDYLEDLINENGKKYPIIVDSFNYFVGMAENAISYYNNIIFNNKYRYVISHKSIRFDDSVECIYNPLNIIFDYPARDIAEYIKNAFFLNNKMIFDELNNYFTKNCLSIVDVKLIIARLMYPSFYFDMYEDILTYNKDEKIIISITNRLDEYEIYLATVINFFKNWYDIIDIPWLYRYK